MPLEGRISALFVCPCASLELDPAPVANAFVGAILVVVKPLDDVTGRRFTNNTWGTKDSSDGSAGALVDDDGDCGDCGDDGDCGGCCLGVMTREVG